MIEAQKLSSQRNWKIRSIRAFYHLCSRHLFDADLAGRIRDLIDEQLMRIGAEPEEVRVLRRSDEHG